MYALPHTRTGCGRLSQYRGIHDFVAALTIQNALFKTMPATNLSIAAMSRPPFNAG
jgi:hypothetical protein